MTKDRDPLTEANVSPENEAFYSAWSERIEADDIHFPETARALDGADAQRTTRALLGEIVGAKELDRAGD